MESLLLKIPNWIEAVALVLMSVSVLATIIAKLTPTRKDDEKVAKYVGYIRKVIKWLPTIGVNPETKNLEEQIKILKAGKKEDDVSKPS